MADILAEYFEALERLKKNQPRNVPKGTKITNDSVALEAGRGKGSIKKSRPVFADLIQAIDQAAQQQEHPTRELEQRLAREKAVSAGLRERYEAAIAREISLHRELSELKKQLERCKAGKITSLR